MSRLNKKRSELSRCKHHQKIEELFKEPFFPPRKPLEQLPLPSSNAVAPLKAAKSMLCTRNVNKRIKRRDEKIEQYKSDIADLSQENKVLQKQLSSTHCVSEKNRVAVYRLKQAKGMATDEKLQIEFRIDELEECFSRQICALETEVKGLSTDLDVAKSERDVLAERVTELESHVVNTKAIIYDDFPPSMDSIYTSLLAPSGFDDIVHEILQLLFGAFSSLLARLVGDHLPGGRNDVTKETFAEETQSVPKTNTVSERDFAQLDRLLREKPNASVLSLEAMILFSNNKTARWLNEKDSSERAVLLQKARACAPEFKRQYQARKEKLREERAKLLQAKQAALMRLQ